MPAFFRRTCPETNRSVKLNKHLINHGILLSLMATPDRFQSLPLCRGSDNLHTYPLLTSNFYHRAGDQLISSSSSPLLLLLLHL